MAVAAHAGGALMDVVGLLIYAAIGVCAAKIGTALMDAWLNRRSRWVVFEPDDDWWDDDD